MFERASYLGYTAAFCVPPLVLLWLRREFYQILAPRIRTILASTLLLTGYGSLAWPIALKHGAWRYGPDRMTNIELFGYVSLDDVVWWALVSFLFSSFVTLSAHYERGGVDVVVREARGLLSSFRNAARGLRVVRLERNATIHVAAAVFVLLEAALFRVSRVEWMIVVVLVGAILGLELLNSALERVASREGVRDRDVALAKDAAAAAVLVVALAAVVVGALIFLRRVLAGIP